jgi:hypothetical protein
MLTNATLFDSDVSSGFLLNHTEIARRTRGRLCARRHLAALARACARHAPPTTPLSTPLPFSLVIDSDREKEIGLGRTWTHRKLGATEAHMSSVILRRVGVEANANQNASLVVDLLGLASQIAGFDASDPIALVRSFSQIGGAGSGALPGDASGALDRVRNFTLASVLSRVNNATGPELHHRRAGALPLRRVRRHCADQRQL